MINLVKLGTVTKTWAKEGKHRMYVNDLCAILGIDPKHVKNGEEGRTARELMAAKLWYDVVADEWVSQGIGQARKDQLIAEILKQTGAEEAPEKVEEEQKEEVVPEFRAEGKPILKLNRMPETLEEMETLMEAEKMDEFKSKAIFLQSSIRAKRLHNIIFEDQEKYNKLYIAYLNQEKAKEGN
jgi:hypothetical protein